MGLNKVYLYEIFSSIKLMIQTGCCKKFVKINYLCMKIKADKLLNSGKMWYLIFQWTGFSAVGNLLFLLYDNI